MVLSVELLKRLNANTDPLPKRLKIAENVFYAVEIPIVHKEDLILQWLCKSCIQDQNAWSLIENCLKTKYLDIKVDVKKLLINTFIETLQKDIKEIHNNVFKCCGLLVSNNGMQQYFISKPGDLGLLIKSLLECVHKILKSKFNIEKQSIETISIELINTGDEVTLMAYNSVVLAIETMTLIFKTTFTVKDNLRSMFIQDILYPLCAIIDHKCTDNTNRLGAVTYKCIQQIFFSKKYIQNKEFLEDENIMQFENLLSILAESAKTKDLQSNLMTFTFFFRAAINIFKSDSAILDLILRELVKSAGIYKKEILNSFLKNLSDVTFNFENKIHNVTLFDYCESMIENILLNKNMSQIDCDLLIQFCYFNPLIIKNKIKNILEKVFMEQSMLECGELIISVMDVCIYLRQEEKVVSTILTALKDSLYQISNTNIDTFFQYKFKEKFKQLVNNVTNSQNISMLRILIYHLKTDCVQVLQSDDICKERNIVILQATTELLTTFLDSICVFESTRTLAFYKKFIDDFTNLRNALSLLIVQMLQSDYNQKITAMLLATVFSWNQMYSTLKLYMPKIIPQDLKSPISEEHWQQLIQRITNFGADNSKNIMNKLILQQVKIFQNTSSKSSIILNDLIGGLEHSWQDILKCDTQVIPFISNEQMSKIVHLLLIHMIHNIDNFDEWIQVLHKDCLQENKRLIIFISNGVFIEIGHFITEGVTKSISKYFHNEFLFEIEMVENERTNNILMSIKEELLQEKWVQTHDILLHKIKMYLEMLSHLPLSFLNTKIRLVTFMFIFALRMECNHSDEVISLCNTILSDLLEKSDINIFEYINPSLLLNQLPHNRITQKSVELFLKNCSSYLILKNVIKSSVNSMKNILFLLKSMEHVKVKLNIDQKAIIKRAERKISKIVIKTIPSKITNTDNMKILNLILRINITNGNIDEKLKDIVQFTFEDIFMNDTNTPANEMLQDGLQLASLILHNQKMFEITNWTLKRIWLASFKYPCTDVILPLLESSEPKEFYELLKQLHSQMIKTLSNKQKDDIEKVCIIWNAILKTNMSSNRSKLRLSAIKKLIQTIQSVIVPEIFWPNLLKLVQNILSTKHLYLPGYIIDMCIFLGLKSLQQTTVLIWSDTLLICTVLLKMRTNLIIDRLPALLLLYRHILNVVVHKSKTIIDKSEEYLFKCLALDIEKFTSSLTKLRKDLIRISPYLITDLLQLFSEDSIATFVKDSLQNCINHLMSVCDNHGIALLSRSLPVSMQEVFKAQLDVYNKFYKYSGKI